MPTREIAWRLCNGRKYHDYFSKTGQDRLGIPLIGLLARLGGILNERKSELKWYTTMTEKAKEDMREYRQEINRKLDMMEREILTELNRRESRNRQKVDGHISSCTTTKQLLQSDLKILNDAKKTAHKADMFAADVKVSKRLAVGMRSQGAMI